MVEERIHPAVRLSVLLIAATAISLGNYSVLAAVFLTVAFCYGYYPHSGFAQGLRMLKRMRWFFLSIAIVYFWFTPGQPLFSPLLIPVGVVPTFEGLELGLHRILVLVLIIFMVNFLLSVTPQPRLLAAIYWWLRPTKYLGMNPQKTALRISLVLDFVQQGQELITQAKQSVTAKSRNGTHKARLLGIAVGEVISNVERRVNQQGHTLVELPQVDDPALRQWLIPLSVLAVCLLL